MREERKFGFTVGGILSVLGILALTWRHRVVTGTAMCALGSILLLLALLLPAWLTGPSRQWRRVGKAIGRANTLVFLSLVYFLVLTPLGVILRLFGRDVLNRRRRPAPSESTWMTYPSRVADRAHFERMF